MIQPPKLSLCLIARDSARTLGACLTSIRPWVDEMIVVDTGSQDDTPQIAGQLGARVFAFPWCDDFSAARNVSLGHARGKWLFWMDSDDTIDETNGRRLRDLAHSAPDSDVLGYVMQVHCPAPSTGGESELTVVDHVKLIRNLPALRFDGRIHEQILPAIRAQGGEIGWTDIHVVHSGSNQSPAGRRRKQERDLRILHLELAERPEHPFTLFNLGMTYADADDYPQAAGYLQRSIAAARPEESHLRKAYALLVNAHARLNQLDAAEQVCAAGRKLFADDPELLFRQGILLQHRGRHELAEAAYIELLVGHKQRHFSSLDPGILGFKARHNLAAVYRELGRTDLAELQWRQAVREMPRYRSGWRRPGRMPARPAPLCDRRRRDRADVRRCGPPANRPRDAGPARTAAGKFRRRPGTPRIRRSANSPPTTNRSKPGAASCSSMAIRTRRSPRSSSLPDGCPTMGQCCTTWERSRPGSANFQKPRRATKPRSACGPTRSSRGPTWPASGRQPNSRRPLRMGVRHDLRCGARAAMIAPQSVRKKNIRGC